MVKITKAKPVKRHAPDAGWVELDLSEGHACSLCDSTFRVTHDYDDVWLCVHCWHERYDSENQDYQD
jgi:ribosomal protein L37AE/L43A